MPQGAAGLYGAGGCHLLRRPAKNTERKNRLPGIGRNKRKKEPIALVMLKKVFKVIIGLNEKSLENQGFRRRQVWCPAGVLNICDRKETCNCAS